MYIKNNTPLGLFMFYNPATKRTDISFSYMENSDIDYFEVQYWNEEAREWTAYDGKSGAVFPTASHEIPQKPLSSTPVSSDEEIQSLRNEIQLLREQIQEWTATDQNEEGETT